MRQTSRPHQIQIHQTVVHQKPGPIKVWLLSFRKHYIPSVFLFVFILSTITTSLVAFFPGQANAATPTDPQSCAAAGGTWVNNDHIHNVCQINPIRCDDGLGNTAQGNYTPYGGADCYQADELASYSYYNLLNTCINNELMSSINIDVGSGKVVAPAGNVWFRDNDAYGYIYPGAKKMNCWDAVTPAMQLWGYGTDYDSFLKSALGCKVSGASSGNPYYDCSNISGRASSFRSTIQSRVYGGNSPVLSRPAKYLLAYDALFNRGQSGACSGNTYGLSDKYPGTSSSYIKSWLTKAFNASSGVYDTQPSNLSGSSTVAGGDYAVTTMTQGTLRFTNLSIVDPSTPVMGPTGASYNLSTDTSTSASFSSITSPISETLYGYHNDLTTRTCNQLASDIGVYNKDGAIKGASGFGQYYLAWLQEYVKRVNPAQIPSNSCPTGQTKDASGACVASGSDATTCAIPGVGWLICPVTSFLADVADNAFSFLSQNFLQVDTSTVSTSSPTYTVWSSMRTIANVAFVIVFLIIIFSQLTGQGVANYGIKKLLPRLIIGAILVNISFFICQVAVDLSNILGVSIRQAFDAAGSGIKLPTTVGSESGNWAGIAVAVLGGATVAWALGISVLLPFLLAAVIAFLMVFLILVLRQVLIILLIVVAPIAFVAFLLPNTEQWFTKWRKMFVGLLLVFPMIGLLFGAAGLARAVINAAAYSATNITTGEIGKIIAAGVVALPLFLLPSLLKRSLDAVGNIGQTMNKLSDRFSRGAQKRAADSGVMKSLAHRKQTKRAQIGAGIYSGSNPISKGRSLLNRQLNKSKAYNALTGDYGTIRGANINKLEDEETKLAESAIQLEARSGKSIQDQFAHAIQSGDMVHAKAAQNILMRMGGSGVMSVRDIMNSNESSLSSGMKSALASNIAENHGQVAKQKAPDLLRWSTTPPDSTGKKPTIEALGGEAKSWSGLSARELADLPDVAFKRAMQSGGVSAETMQALQSERMRENLTDDKLNSIKTDYAKPSAVSATAGREFSRETIEKMGVDNVTAAVEKRGGVEALKDGDIVSIINAHGGTPVANDARQEAIKRDILQEQKPRDPRTMPKQ